MENAQFTVNIECSNFAFDIDSDNELSRILRELANDLQGWPVFEGTNGTIHDANGNLVGNWDLGKVGQS